MDLNKIEALIDKLRNQSYQPNCAKKLPSLEDKLVQEVIRSILESIYEHQFCEYAHAFRPNKSCHTALNHIKNTYSGVRWFIKGGIKDFINHLDHHTLITILRKKINDDKFIHLIWKFLRAGYVNDWVFHQTFSGTPQGGIISPILSNIYLNELDHYIVEYASIFMIKEDQGHNRIRQNSEINDTTYNSILEQTEVGNGTDVERANEWCDLFERNERCIKYVRYADVFLIGVIASKKETEKIKQDLLVFLAGKLQLTLCKDMTMITNSQKNTRFLGYDIRVEKCRETSVLLDGKKNERLDCHAKLSIPHEIYFKKLIHLGALCLRKNNQWKPVYRRTLIHRSDLDIIRQYNAEIGELYKYYRLAGNPQVLHSFHQTMKCSMIKTFAAKYNSTVREIFAKFSSNGHLCIRYMTKEGPCFVYFIGEKFEGGRDHEA